MKRLPGQYKENKWQEKGKSLQFVQDRLLQLTSQSNASEITKGESSLLQNNKMPLRADGSIYVGAAFPPPVILAAFLLVVFVVNPGIDQQSQRQNTADHAQGDRHRDMPDIDNQHFHPNKDQHDRQAIFQH